MSRVEENLLLPGELAVVMQLWLMSLVLLQGFAGILASCKVREYTFVLDTLNWTRARNYCMGAYTDLVSTQNELQQSTLVQAMGKRLPQSYWIGLEHNQEGWRWSWGVDSGYRSWEQQPSGRTENCVYTLSQTWFNGACDGMRYSVCVGRDTGNILRYILVETLMTWPQAQQYCQSRYIDLAGIFSKADDIAVSKLTDSDVWIGLHNRWVWSDGSELGQFEMWAEGEPQELDFDVARMDREGFWYSENSSVEMPFICYKEKFIPCSKDEAKILQRTVLRVGVRMNPALDPEDPAIKNSVFDKISAAVSRQIGNFTLNWREQSDGRVFQRVPEEEDTGGQCGSSGGP